MVKLEQLSALGTYWWFELMDADQSDAKELLEAIESRLQTFNDTYSRFNENSLVYRLNTEGFLSLSDVPDPEEFLELLAIGVKLYEDSEGVFNFLTGQLQVAQGYGGADSVRPADDSFPDPRTDLLVQEDRIILENGAIDLGGFAKGWLTDSIATDLVEMGISHFLINGGGDMYATSESDGSPVTIAVEHPVTPDTFIAQIPLLNQGFAASSTYKRKWEKDGQAQQHILKEHSQAVAAHVIGPDALTADVFATLSCIIDPNYSPALLEAEKLDFLLMVDDQIAMSLDFEKYLLR